MNTTGVVSYSDLRQEGASRADIDRALAAGNITRVARGWYSYPHADQRVVRALAAGGRLGCLSGCAVYGLWVPSDPHLHVVYGRGKVPAPKPGVDLHLMDLPRPKAPMWTLPQCLAQVAHRHDAETALIVLESALNLGLVNQAEIDLVLASLPATRVLLSRFLDRAESGSETRVRLFLRRRTIPVEPQVRISGIGRVDLLVGRRLIIECDSDAHHRSKEEHREDRRRDLAARDLGFDVIRLSYVQIWRDWAATQQSLLRQLRLRRHVPRRASAA